MEVEIRQDHADARIEHAFASRVESDLCGEEVSAEDDARVRFGEESNEAPALEEIEPETRSFESARAVHRLVGEAEEPRPPVHGFDVMLGVEAPQQRTH